ncbi:nuclear transport factor 2 family protein [Flavobacterium hercynium]|uniref:SnoaL-like domain-containing protein n=1 Tax=Flavobacterium hercynium TaxID=387094 RepID=A0A226H079_9FLAO|nr:nuclear transport factor 2 family protein [Flavobacterium hercynium]OXA86910.1 hypothetical protein B0A66_17230 [Flavobacterium hercynium]SMP37140.1 hypothetical protein SAMN06265346_12722 [Flavobacterium hercynium]
MEKRIQGFIETINTFDVEQTLQLFAENAIIDDVSVGEKFTGKSGVEKYLKTYFVGYNTNTKLENIEIVNSFSSKAKVDFKGNFGHEKGGLDFTFNNEGFIVRIDAYLE